jgi:hypothetical protein
MNAMRETGTIGWTVHNSSDALKRALRLAAITAGIGLVMSAGVARAEDPEDDDSISDKIIRNVMTGLGGTNMENQGIDYRERSPLVVPPKIDLPPPEATSADVKAANWPKDPDVQRRKAAAEAARKSGRPEDTIESARTLTPAEMASKRVKTTIASETDRPGDPNKNIVLSPSQLGYNGGLFKNVFGGTKVETTPFKGEPTRDSLTMPPTGYQTPSPSYAYGTGTKELMKQADPVNGKY